jgi:hypothetical protein
LAREPKLSVDEAEQAVVAIAAGEDAPARSDAANIATLRGQPALAAFARRLIVADRAASSGVRVRCCWWSFASNVARVLGH